MARRYHSLSQEDNPKYIIGIVRNPIDSVASIIALLKHNNEEDWNRQRDWNQEVVHTMLQIMQRADIVIDFNELVNDPETIAQKISSITGLPLFPSDEPIVVLDEPNSMFIPTSKNVEGYDDIHNLVKSYYLSPAIEAYKVILDRVI